MPKKRVLMCAPTYFDIEYSINPWMRIEEQPDAQRTKDEWYQLYDAYQKLDMDITLIKPIKHLPDMVFTANGGLVIDGRVMLARFKHRERQGETQHFEHWFRDAGYNDIRMPKYDFEGEGDALVCGELVLAGSGYRSSPESHSELQDYFDREVVSLRLIDPRFYHLDTCLAVLNDDTVMFYPEALDQRSRDALRRAVPNVIEASTDDALAFGLNAVSDGHNVLMSHRATDLMKQLKEAGYNPIGVDISEFQKSGGGVKCLTLELRA